MGLLTACAVAFVALRRNRFRTYLAMIGISIGVAAVITIVALGRGARSAIEADVRQAGTNMIQVLAGNWTSGGVRMGMGSSSRLTADDADSIRQLPGVLYVAPSVRARRQLIVAGQNWSANVEGTGVDLPLIRSWPLESGRFFTGQEERVAAKVCVIGTTVRNLLFGRNATPLGATIRIGAEPFVVIGVLSSKGESGSGDDQDDLVFVPYTTAQKKLLGVTYLRNISVSATSFERLGDVAARITTLLRMRHGIEPGAPDDFRVRTSEDVIGVRTRMTRTMTSLLSGIAAVSLLVGGIGVMNIMLVSVTERTREIGIRLAVGARSRDVLVQFLTEAVLISAGGGAAGVALAYLCSTGLTELFMWPTDFALGPVLMSVAFAGSIGIFFGWYPAHNAARTDPIDALRFE
jgi:putative ABC transport system permease protein